MKRFVFIVVLIAVSSSCRSGRSRYGVIEPVSELSIERMGINRLPLECSGVSREGDQLTLRYRFESEGCLCTTEPILSFTEPQQWTALVNGVDVEPVRMRLQQNEEARFDISGFLHDGENMIELRGSGELPAVTLSGEFDVVPSEQGGWRVKGEGVLELGSLVSQGLSYFAGSVAYNRRFEVPMRVGKRILRLSGWQADSCSLWVNYEKVADVTTESFEMNIGPYLNPGTNDVVVRLSARQPASSEGRNPEDFGLFEAFTLE